MFQFTHPGKGATCYARGEAKFMLVSIHAPWEGCDLPSLTMRYALNSFNSRTLGRVRQLKKGQSFDAYLFQFTHPGKGATRLHGQILLLLMFQFTHPGKGATTLL